MQTMNNILPPYKIGTNILTCHKFVYGLFNLTTQTIHQNVKTDLVTVLFAVKIDKCIKAESLKL